MMKISYTLDGKAYTYEYEITNDIWDAGKKYIYDITFKLHEIFVNPSVTDWVADPTTLVDIPQFTAEAAANNAQAIWNINCLAKSYTAQVAGFSGTENVTYAKSSGVDFATNPATAAAVDGVYTNTFTTSANTSGATKTQVYTLTGGTSGNVLTITVNQYAGVTNSGTFSVTKDAASYTFQVYGLTPNTSYTLSSTDASSVISSGATGTVKTDADGVATVTLGIAANESTARTATLTLTATGSTANVTISQAAGGGGE